MTKAKSRVKPRIAPLSVKERLGIMSGNLEGMHANLGVIADQLTKLTENQSVVAMRTMGLQNLEKVMEDFSGRLLRITESHRNMEDIVCQLYELREKQNEQMNEIIRLMRSVMKPMRLHPVAGEVVAAAQGLVDVIEKPEGFGGRAVALNRLRAALAAVPTVQ